MLVHPASKLHGTIVVPADKSISHRYAILAGMARGVSRITNFSPSQDCGSTLNCLEQLGVEIVRQRAEVTLTSPGWENLREPSSQLDAGNSGTTMRLLSGVLAARPMESTIAGDASLNRRPMGRIMTPLMRMGAAIEARDGQFPPLRIHGTRLVGISYELPVASAQVKSCLLLAGLAAEGRTVVIETQPTRDHTERAFTVFGISLEKEQLRVSVQGPQPVSPADVQVPGDFSAAVFFILAALALPGSEILIPGVGLNPSRTGLLTLLRQSGARIEQCEAAELHNEPRADLVVRHSPAVLENFPEEIGAEWIPNLIDEIPALAVFGTQLVRGLTVRNAEELRKKESDRIQAVTGNLRELGVAVEESADGFHIPPGQQIRGGAVKSYGDHRIAMAFGIAGLLADGPVHIDDPGCTAISFPDFFNKLELAAG